ncbi:hypothetical protein DBV23_03385 [Edwardsiella ictaluri]|uniref:Uncharacterized protein n=1 Tax=Edwardsiella ictaluri (strain 93-146) TaxID=634503 RepID=C5BBH0_EDWI9|nr:hypothetical protein NT01EI_0992 [Edwardsiella ictaluri 93-146]ARD40582.1 hypothetical protein B6E78_15400 [Edwardsiella ictaluri]AVZ81416.1 hypothetical protein DBV23_03385 [Edwardsiella ictaluri]KOO56359.1 hypothetical protein ACS33_00725 [Edwardsiella ictaluri]
MPAPAPRLAIAIAGSLLHRAWATGAHADRREKPHFVDFCLLPVKWGLPLLLAVATMAATQTT